MDWKPILLLAVLPIIVCTEAKVILDETVPECLLKQEALFCYFEHSNIQEVYLEPLNKTIKSIYVQDVKKLHLDESVCNDVFFNNISEIVIAGEKDEQCKDGFDLLARNSSLNKIPENVKNVSLEFSNITSLATDRSLEELSVKNSNIEVLRISGTFVNNSKVVLEGSHIVKTEKLILDAGSEFIVKDSTFEDVPEESILLHPNVTKVVERVSGDFKYDDLVIFRKNQDLLANNSNKDFDFSIVGVSIINGFFILLFICIVSIVLYKRSHRKPKNKCTDVESGVNDSKSTNQNEEIEPILGTLDQNSFYSSQESSVNLDMTRCESEQSEPNCQDPNDEESDQRGTKEGENDSHELLENAIESKGNVFDKKPLLDKSLTLNESGTYHMKGNREIKLTYTDELQSTVSHQNALMETKASTNDNENNEKMGHKEDIEYIYSKLRHHQLNNPHEIRTINRKQHSISDILKMPLSNQDTDVIKTDGELTNYKNPVNIKTSSNATIISKCNKKTGNKPEISGNYYYDDKQLDISFQRNFDKRYKANEKNPKQISTKVAMINDSKKYLLLTKKCSSKSIIDVDKDKNKIKSGEDHQINFKQKIDGVNRQMDILEEIFNALMTIKSINPEKVIKKDDIILVKLSKESGYIEIKDQEDFIKFLNKNEIKISGRLWNKLGGKVPKKLIHQDE